MAFKGREEYTSLKERQQLFRYVFGYETEHIGQSGGKSTPDVLLLSDSDNYRAVIDNKAYSTYTISGDHRRMVYKHRNINSYSHSSFPIGFFSYIAVGLVNPSISKYRT